MESVLTARANLYIIEESTNLDNSPASQFLIVLAFGCVAHLHHLRMGKT